MWPRKQLDLQGPRPEETTQVQRVMRLPGSGGGVGSTERGMKGGSWGGGILVAAGPGGRVTRSPELSKSEP